MISQRFLRWIPYCLILCFFVLNTSETEISLNNHNHRHRYPLSTSFSKSNHHHNYPQQLSPPVQDLKTQETFDTFDGALGPLRTHLDPLGILKSGEHFGPTTSYDDFHKYGGIGKKLLGSLGNSGSTNGYNKHYYGDTEHLDQGLNKYSGHHQKDKYGGKSGNHKDYHDTHVYTRNRGYGYEKHYMYDKEYSTGKSLGSHQGHHSYYGDHDHGSKSGIDAYKKFDSKKFGKSVSDYGITTEPTLYNDYSDTYNDYGDSKDGLLKHKKEFHQLKKHLDHHHHRHYSPPPVSYAKAYEYVPVVPVIESYGGVVAPPTHTAITSGLATPTYGIIESNEPHYYNPATTAYIQQEHLPDDTVYLSSASNTRKINTNDNLDTEGESVNTLSPRPTVTSTTTTTNTADNEDNIVNTSPLISTRSTPSSLSLSPSSSSSSSDYLTTSKSVNDMGKSTMAESFQRIQSAVHATPPIIATHVYHHF